MNRVKLNKYLGVALLLLLVLVSLSMILGGIFYDAPLSALLVTSPVWVSYTLTLIASLLGTGIGLIIYSSIAGVYFVNLVIGFTLVFFYLPGILNSRAFSEAEGYWFAFAMGGAMKFSGLGLAIGLLVAVGYLTYERINRHS